MSHREPKRGSLARRLLPLLAALCLGALLGRITADAPSPASDRAPAAGPSGARSEAGVTISFPRTPSGAASAIAAYQDAFADPAILRPGVLRARVEAVATPDYAARMLAANGPGAARLAGGPIGVGIAHGVRTLYAAVPIGYRVLDFSPARAEVETWGLTLLGNAGSVEPSAWFGISRTELVWAGDRWRIAQVHSGFGPTPPLATRPGPLGGYDVLDLARTLHRYEPAG